MPPQPARVVKFSATQDVPIADLKTARLAVPVAEQTTLKALQIAVDVEHTYIGDLVVSIRFFLILCAPRPSRLCRVAAAFAKVGGGLASIKSDKTPLKIG